MNKLGYFLVENTWLRRDIMTIGGRTLAGLDCGWGNGYVAIPKGHPCFGMGYDQIHSKYDIEAHGGLTFAEAGEELVNWQVRLDENQEIPQEFLTKDYWIVGFDTAHYQDTLQNWSKDHVERHTKALLKQFEDIK